MAYAHKSQRYPSKLVLLSTTSHHKVMSAFGGPQLQFQLAKGWVATIDLKSALWVSFDIVKRCCSPADAVTACDGQSSNNHSINLLFTYEMPGPQRSRSGLRAPIEPKCLNIFHHQSTQTQGHMLVLVIPGIYATQYAFPGRQLFGRFLRMMCGALAGSGKRLFASELNVER